MLPGPMNPGLAFGLTSLLAGTLGIALMGGPPRGGDDSAPLPCAPQHGDEAVRRAIDIARGLVATLAPDQLRALRGDGSLPLSVMDDLQRQLLVRLVDGFTADCAPDAAATRWQQLAATAGAPIEFSWVEDAAIGAVLAVAVDGLRIDCAIAPDATCSGSCRVERRRQER